QARGIEKLGGPCHDIAPEYHVCHLHCQCRMIHINNWINVIIEIVDIRGISLPIRVLRTNSVFEDSPKLELGLQNAAGCPSTRPRCARWSGSCRVNGGDLERNMWRWPSPGAASPAPLPTRIIDRRRRGITAPGQQPRLRVSSAFRASHRNVGTASRGESSMNVVKALATVVGTAVGFGVVGIGIGAFLGKVTPSFLREMLPMRDPAAFDPLEMGIGLGLTNGLIWGLVVGILLVAILAWRETRLVRSQERERAGPG
ncbi:MAG: hypothetical protein U1E76_26695, partial [Planctomycetota bacterium]